MRDLNIELALACGVVAGRKQCWNPLQGFWNQSTYKIGGNTYDIWNPIKDLSQLEKCWQALSWEQKATYKQLVIDHDVQSVFESPEQHAELILKAKQ
jgi:hypothetical protein